MSQLRMIICRVDESDDSKMTELASYEIPEIQVGDLMPARALDDLEASTHRIGQQILQGLFQARWHEIDKELAESYRQSFSPWGSGGRWEV